MKVDAIIIGAGRSGTTTIFQYLENHEQVAFSSIKEVHFFSVNDLYKRGLKYYHSFFNEKDKKVFVSADTYLFIDYEAINKIYEYNPQMKFIVMLRNPVYRSFSGYKYAVNNGYLSEKISFIESIEKEKNIISKLSIEQKNNLCNAYQSLYFQHLQKWTSVFPKENFLIVKTEDLKKSYKSVLKKISDFLQISDFDYIEEIKANTSKKVKSKTVEQLLLNRNNFFRRLLRNIVPNFMKNFIFRSGMVDKIHNLNKTDANDIDISNNEIKFAEKYFEQDLKKLKEFYNIYFDEY